MATSSPPSQFTSQSSLTGGQPLGRGRQDMSQSDIASLQALQAATLASNVAGVLAQSMQSPTSLNSINAPSPIAHMPMLQPQIRMPSSVSASHLHGDMPTYGSYHTGLDLMAGRTEVDPSSQWPRSSRYELDAVVPVPFDVEVVEGKKGSRLGRLFSSGNSKSTKASTIGSSKLSNPALGRPEEQPAWPAANNQLQGLSANVSRSMQALYMPSPLNDQAEVVTARSNTLSRQVGAPRPTTMYWANQMPSPAGFTTESVVQDARFSSDAMGKSQSIKKNGTLFSLFRSKAKASTNTISSSLAANGGESGSIPASPSLGNMDTLSRQNSYIFRPANAPSQHNLAESTAPDFESRMSAQSLGSTTQLNGLRRASRNSVESGSQMEVNLAANDVVVGWTTLTMNQTAPFQAYILIQLGQFEVYSDDTRSSTSRIAQIPLTECHLSQNTVKSTNVVNENGPSFLSFYALGDQWTVICANPDAFLNCIHAIRAAAVPSSGHSTMNSPAPTDGFQDRSATLRRMVAGVTATGGMQTASFVYSIEKKSLASTLAMLLPEENGMQTHISRQQPLGSIQDLSGSANELNSPSASDSAFPPYVNPPETEVDIAPDGKIMSLTINKAIELLSPATVAPPNPVFLNTFMFTYRSFIKPLELIAKLEHRYMGIDQVVWQTSMSSLRCYHIDFKSSTEVKDRLQKFLTTAKDVEMITFGPKLLAVMNKMAAGQTISPFASDVAAEEVNKTKHLTAIDAKMIARRLTTLDHQRFANLRPVDFFVQLWADKSSAVVTEGNVHDIISWFNKISYWCATEIITTPELKIRVKVIEHFIKIAKECHVLGNYNSLFAIISGMSNASVTRLKETWEAVSPKATEVMKYLENEMSVASNFKRYRAIMDQAVQQSKSSSFIPILGLFLKDLLFLSDGNAKFLPNGHVNMDRLQTMVNKVDSLLCCQRARYHLAMSTDMIKDCDNLFSQIKVAKDDALYKLSLLNEARSDSSSTMGSTKSGSLRKERMIEKWEREAREQEARDKKNKK